MKSFKKELQTRLKIIICINSVVIAFVGFAILVYPNVSEISVAFSDAHSLTITISMFAAMLVTTVGRIARLYRAIKNEDTLEEQYIKETDERGRIIVLKSSRACINIMVTLLGAGIIISFLYNKTVFYTLGSVLLLMLILYIALRKYFSNKMI